MQNKREKSETADIGAMHKRRVTMADGRRYLIYYTFGDNAETENNGGQNAPDRNETNEGKNV